MYSVEIQKGIVINNMPFDSGFMTIAGHNTYTIGNEIITRYDTASVPYIVWQEEGFTHWITGRRVTVNEGFISRDTVGEINNVLIMGTLGVHPKAAHYNRMARQRLTRMFVSTGKLREEGIRKFGGE